MAPRVSASPYRPSDAPGQVRGDDIEAHDPEALCRPHRFGGDGEGTRQEHLVTAAVEQKQENLPRRSDLTRARHSLPATAPFLDCGRERGQAASLLQLGLRTEARS